MSRLIGPMFEGSPLLLLPLLALALFALVFTSVLVRLALRGAKAFDPAARMPLDDEQLPSLRSEGPLGEGRPGERCAREEPS